MLGPRLRVEARIQMVVDLVLRSHWQVLVKVLVHRHQVLVHLLLLQIFFKQMILELGHLLIESVQTRLLAVQFVEVLLVVQHFVVVFVQSPN